MLDERLESPPGQINVLGLENKKVNFESRYNEIFDGSGGPGGYYRLEFEDSKYLFVNQMQMACSNVSDRFNVFHLNCQGLNSSLDFINEISSLSLFQVIGLTETWLNDYNSELLHISGYNLYTKNRQLRRHGGLAAYIRSDIRASVREDILIYKEMVFESFILQLELSGRCGYVLVVYRPPSGSLIEFYELLEEQLEKIPHRSPIFIMGDFNIDLLDNGSNTDRFLNLMISFGYIPAINISTRVTRTSSKCLDNIFSNYMSGGPSVLISDTSDHFGVFASYSVCVDNKNSTKKSSLKLRMLLDKDALLKCRNDLANKDWNTEFSISADIDSKFRVFYQIIKQSLEKCSKNINNNRRKPSKKPWITPSLLRSINKKNNLYEKKVRHPCDVNERIYKSYRNALNRLLRRARQDYYKIEFEKASGNPLKTWNVIRSTLGQSSGGIPQEIFRKDGTSLKNPEEICEEFANHFSTVGRRVKESIISKPGDQAFQNYLHKELEISLNLLPVQESEVRNIVYGMKGTNSGSDIVSIRVIKILWDVIAQTFVSLINQCLKEGVFPSCFKSAKVIPIHKGGNTGDVENYRPISILPIMSRILEKCFSVRMYQYLEDQRIFTPTQFGFRQGCTTEQANIYLTSIINMALDNGYKVATVFLDIVKAFDTVSHDILLMKCEIYGIRGPALSFLRSFLSCRKQYVQIGNMDSHENCIECGVPQGSVLGPLLFLIFVNDLPQSVSKLETRMSEIVKKDSAATVPMFADDTSLVVIAKSERLLLESVRGSLNEVSRWLRVNQLKVNPSKSNFLIFSRTSNYYPWIQHIAYEDGMIARQKAVKYLGIIIDETLSFRSHIETLSRILSRNLGMIRKLKYMFPISILRLLYFSLIHPYILYCSSVYMGTFSSIVSPVRIIQNKSIRVLSGKSERDSVREVYRDFRILPAAGLHHFYILVFMHRYNMKQLPECFNGWFYSRWNIHNQNTRGKNDYYTPPIVSARSTFSFVIKGINLWNNLDNDMKKLENFSGFKAKLKEKLLSKYDF